MFDLSRFSRTKTSHIAAIDLGSNSFHMIIAKWDNDQLVIVDRLRDPVRMGWGLGTDGSLSEEAGRRALVCLEKFGERLRDYPSRSVRIVGTKTLRSINNSSQFLLDAQQAVGHPVEIISGDEEARLIYLGVAHCIAPRDGNRLVMDIGGGSTEIIIGEGMSPELKESLNMGCVAITKKFFLSGMVDEQNVLKALIACKQELAPVAEAFMQFGWSEVLGASGTIKAVSKVCASAGWSEGEIKLEHLKNIVQLYIHKGTTDLKISGLSDDRQPVFLGGVIVLMSLFESLNLQKMLAADWALREGLLFDLKGRLENHDIRQGSVDALATRFHVNEEKSKAVEKTALILLKQIANEWNLNDHEASKLLGWSARLYSAGLDIAHNDYHKHSAYIVQNVDLAGFSRIEQTHLAILVLAHRKRFPFKHFPLGNEDLIHLAILLRIAVIFHRGKKQEADLDIKLSANKKKLKLKLSASWAEQHPLTIADLETEMRYLDEIGYSLQLS
jgi:exopolyphosphatase / guanosine-5'-triphosphate,3'-diphosphate pyrophosphatase